MKIFSPVTPHNNISLIKWENDVFCPPFLKANFPPYSLGTCVDDSQKFMNKLIITETLKKRFKFTESSFSFVCLFINFFN